MTAQTKLDGAEAVKAEIVSGVATITTVTTLQKLLTQETSSGATSSTGKTVSKPASRSKTAPKPRKGISTSTQSESALSSSSPRERYALATEVVNVALSVLTENVKARSSRKSPSTVKDVEGTSPLRRVALHPRSGNATPVRSSPVKHEKMDSSSPSSFPRSSKDCPTSSVIIATAECARVGFAFLRSHRTQDLVGVKEMPTLQLERGMLALISKLIALGLDDLAVKELCALKRQFEVRARVKETTTREKETLATLLRLKIDFDRHPELLPSAITYQQYVIRVISIAGKPRVVEQLVESLGEDITGSPTALILQNAKITGAEKAAKQLDSLSQAILALCPSVSSSADELALSSTSSPRPSFALKLQVIALRIRKSWWKMVDHQVDVVQELLDPLSRCISAFVRRSSNSSPGETHEQVVNAVSVLGPLESTALTRPLLFNIHNALYILAGKAQMDHEMHQWIADMEEDCRGLPSDHSRNLAILVNKFLLDLGATKNSGKMETTLQSLQAGLAKKTLGNSSDYDLLLLSLTDLCKTLATVKHVDSTIQREMSNLAASFAVRYSKSLPGKNQSHLQAIITFALHHSKSVDESLSWVTGEAVKILIGAGGLQPVVVKASSSTLSDAWMSSHSSVSLSRVLRMLLLRGVRSNANETVRLIFDDADLSTVERGVIMELQFKYACELASKKKYHDTLKRAVADLLRVLAEVYAKTDFPVRRGRVALAVFRLREIYPVLVPLDVFHNWVNDLHIDPSNLAEDVGLEGYVQDLTAGIAVSKLFTDHHSPTPAELSDTLAIWKGIVESCQDAAALSRRVDDLESLIAQLKSINAYVRMLGDDYATVFGKQLLIRLIRLQHGETDEWCSEMVSLARHLLDMGLSNMSGDLLVQVKRVVNNNSLETLSKLKHQVLTAEHLLAIDQHEQCGRHLQQARLLRDSLPPKNVTRGQRHEYEVLHAQGWLVHSQYMLATGFPHEALGGAKRAVRFLNSIWSALERSDARDEHQQQTSSSDLKEPVESDIGSLTQGVSKLKLTPKEVSTSVKKPAEKNSKGAAFWPLIPLLVKSLMHLSDMYKHHGIYNEANYYSERALHFAQVVRSPLLLSRARSHRAALLLVAGCLDDAELCLAQDAENTFSHASLAVAERLCVKADLHAKEGALEEACALYEKAEQVFDVWCLGNSLSELEGLVNSDSKATEVSNSKNKDQVAKNSGSQKPLARTVKTKTSSVTSRGSKAKPPSARRTKPTKQMHDQDQSEDIGKGDVYMFSKWRAVVTLRKALVHIRLGQSADSVLIGLQMHSTNIAGSLQSRVVRYFDLMSRATAALEMDVTLNVLSESVLSCPAISQSRDLQAQKEALKPVASSTQRQPTSNTKATSRSTKAKPNLKVDHGQLLSEARACLIEGLDTSLQMSSTDHTHLESGLLSSVSVLLSAAASATCSGTLDPVAEGLAIDVSRLKALQYEQHVVSIDRLHSADNEAHTWPTENGTTTGEIFTPAEYQENYINIIPQPWTAVSLCLSDDCSELYIARYHAGDAPFILRLPFARHKPEGVDDEDMPFDFLQGRDELREILELSNQSCHTSSDPEAKSTKSKWWSEREELDKRLHELLINIENIWFGGFKAILSPQICHPDQSDKFRASLDEILDRHLPSRQATRGLGKKLVLDNNVLELFIRLGDDQDGEIDLDDALTDLLYFVVDLLQFNGERNAYDEIDFDSMAVEVLDALRVYHTEVSLPIGVEDQHLILVLDRRLQAFPWESLPYLEDVSVSRVGSMLSLRECILAMRQSGSANTFSSDPMCQPVVSNTSGTYILNPSSDLKTTQATLSPALTSLADKKGASWNSIVAKAPTEDEFCTALSEKSMMLYFGHGAGSQYIRPRAIRRLDSCSEVVWLMGCSSGAVVEHGDLEPAAVPLAYLLAGGKRSQSTLLKAEDDAPRASKCLSVVANLWDVTDKDIDRFSLAVGERWGLWPAAEKQLKFPAKTPRKREIVTAPATPQQGVRAPKTPKVCKTPVTVKTPARSKSRSKAEGPTKQSLVQAVAQSRDVCYLRYLNGAAPVVFGIPVYLSD